MTGVEWGAAESRGLFGHLVRWLGSLRRAGGQRTIESKLRAGELAGRWPELGFRLEDLGLSKLAGHREIRGRRGAEPDSCDPDFPEQACIQLDRIEALARLTSRALDRK